MIHDVSFLPFCTFDFFTINWAIHALCQNPINIFQSKLIKLEVFKSLNIGSLFIWLHDDYAHTALKACFLQHDSTKYNRTD